MRNPVVLLTLCLASCQTAEEQSRPLEHVGPVTGLTAFTIGNIVGWNILSCSQAGVIWGFGSPTTAATPACHTLKIRPFDVAGYRSLFGGEFLIGGGVPGKSGEVGLEAFGVVAQELGRKHVKKKVANDLVYSVALGCRRVQISNITVNEGVAAVGCANGKVLLLETSSLEILREVHRHTAACRDVCFSLGSKLLASGGRDGLVIVSPVDGGKPVILQDHTAGVECLRFSHDGLLVSGALDGKVRIHEGKYLRRTYQKLGAEVLSRV